MAKRIDPEAFPAMAADMGTITMKLDPESLAILERLATALEALVKQQTIAHPAQPATPPTGPFFDVPEE